MKYHLCRNEKLWRPGTGANHTENQAAGPFATAAEAEAHREVTEAGLSETGDPSMEVWSVDPQRKTPWQKVLYPNPKKPD